MLTKYRQTHEAVNRNVSSAKLSPMPGSRAIDRLEVADHLHSAAIHLLRRARAQDVLSGQGPARLSALSVLVFAGPMTLGQLAAAEQVKPPTMTRIVAGLKRAGLALVDADSRDARRIRISATHKGQKLLQQARERRIRAVVEMLVDATDRQMRLLGEAVEIIETAVRKKP